MLYLLIALISFAAVMYLIIKKVNAAAAIFFVGVLLLMIAAISGKAEPSVEIKPSGNSFYDELLVIEALFKSRFSGIGMAIMVLFGFVSYESVRLFVCGGLGLQVVRESVGVSHG
ncbi:hypothetical protein FRC0456_01100 [Corynebacterium diphtheriae]|nr:hypothetical protein FRC0456_01100 [Corynebacterium diphtheriae]